MSRKPTLINIDVAAINKLADDVGRLSTDGFREAAVTALNDTLDGAYEMGRERITVGINLTDDYLRRRVELEPATKTNLTATLKATAARDKMTRLTHYEAQMVIVPRSNTRKSRSAGRIGIPAGQRQGGVRVEVTRGSPKTNENMFMLPLRQGQQAGSKLGVFMRVKGRLQHLYGPAVYQLFGYQIPRIEDEVADQLQEATLDAVEAQVRKVLA